MKKKELVATKKREIAKTGRLLFSAFFGEKDDFERELLGEGAAGGAAREAPTESTPTVVERYSFVRCTGCGRQHSVSANVDTRNLERTGWRRLGNEWRCPFCAGQ